MSDAALSFGVLGVVLVLFVWNRFPVEIVAILSGLTLCALRVIGLEDVLHGFSEPTVPFIASLFVVSEGLEEAGVTGWAGQTLGARVGEGNATQVILVMLPTALLTSLISLNGAVAALLPMVVVMATRLGRSPSQLLLPMVFAAHAGSLLTLTGTPVNVVVSDALVEAGQSGFGFLSFALVGVPLLAGTVAIVALFGKRLLPERRARTIPDDFGDHSRTLVEQYGIDAAHPAGPELYTGTHGVVEVVVPPRSDLVGESVFAGMITPRCDLQILAVQRKGDDLGMTDEAVLAVGDVLLLRGRWTDLACALKAGDMLTVDEPGAVRRQAVPMGAGARRALLVLGAMVALLISGIVAPVVAGILAAAAMILSGVITAKQAYRAIAWPAVLLVAGMAPLATAMTRSGAAEQVAHALVGTFASIGPRALLASLFLLTAILGQIISNMATALILIPIALSAASETGVSPRPLLMAVTVAAAASFLTPVATPVNMMVLRPGGYRFGDYWKLGAPLLLLYFVTTVVLVPVFWRF